MQIHIFAFKARKLGSDKFYRNKSNLLWWQYYNLGLLTSNGFEKSVPTKANKNQVYLYCCVFRTAFGCCVHPKASWNTFKLTKKVENGSKKCFNQLLRACSTWKLVEKHSTLFRGKEMVPLAQLSINCRISLSNLLSCFETAKGVTPLTKKYI